MMCTRAWMAAWMAALAAAVLPGGCDRGELDRPERVAPAPVDAVAPPIRVLLLQGDELRVGAAGAGFELAATPARQEVFRGQAKREYVLDRPDGQWRLRDERRREVAQWPAAAVLELRPQEGAVALLGRDSRLPFRGIIRFLPEQEDRFAAVNVLDLESYLCGVVGAEMPPHWHLAALRAQAIACRTYALHRMHERGARGEWDLGSTQSSQVYGGVIREGTRVRQAVRESRGVVLGYGEPGSAKLFPAFFSSTCGGHTQNAEVTFGYDLPPLAGRSCPYCASVATPTRYRWGPVEIDKQAVMAALRQVYPQLAALGENVDIRVTQRSSYGRVERVVLVGAEGRRETLRGEDLRLSINRAGGPQLLSSWYELRDAGNRWRFEDGHGWGHGVGFCQCGGEGMARQGYDSTAILRYYYPGSTLMRAY